MDEREFSIRLADWDSDQAALRQVRKTVFVEEQAVPETEEWDGLDGECVHALAEAPGAGAIGTGRLHPSGKLGRMAVLADWRGRGVGEAILRRLLVEATRQEIDTVYLHAQVPVIDFYARFGFLPDGEEFMEAGIPHRLMRRQITGRRRIEDDDWPTGTRWLCTSREELAEAVAEVASTAARALSIFTPDLEHGVYDTARFLDVVKRLVLSRSHARIRVLISDPGRVQRSVNRFLYVGRRLSTFVEFRHLPEAYQGRTDAFMIADTTGLVYRAANDRWDGIADTHEPRLARRYLEEFDQVWQLSDSAAEIREVKL